MPLFMLVTLCFTVMCIDNKNLNERLGLTFTLLLASIGYTSQLRDHLPKCALAYPNIVNRPIHGHVTRWHGLAWHGMHALPSSASVACSCRWHRMACAARASGSASFGRCGYLTFADKCSASSFRTRSHSRIPGVQARIILHHCAACVCVHGQVYLALHLSVCPHRHGIAARVFGGAKRGVGKLDSALLQTAV